MLSLSFLTVHLHVMETDPGAASEYGHFFPASGRSRVTRRFMIPAR